MVSLEGERKKKKRTVGASSINSHIISLYSHFLCKKGWSRGEFYLQKVNNDASHWPQHPSSFYTKHVHDSPANSLPLPSFPSLDESTTNPGNIRARGIK